MHIIVCYFFLFFVSLPLLAQPLASQPGPNPSVVPRVVIGLYDPKDEDGLRFSSLHTFAEMPLNHLGLVVEYHDITKGLPAIKGREDVRGVISWFTPGYRMKNPVAYLQWASEVVDTGKKFVIMGDPGFFEDTNGRHTPSVMINRFLKRIGLLTNENWIDITYDVRLIYKDPDMVEFEHPYSGYREPFFHVRAIGNDVTSYLRVRKGYSSDNDSDLVVTGKKGSYVATGYATFYKEEENGRVMRQWYVAPFLFFRRAFDTDEVPKPDTTTLAGRRIYYSHIDGDGWNNMTQLEHYRVKPVISAKVILEDVIKKYDDLPVSVAPIAADIDMAWVGKKESRDAAAALFLLPHVEMASHTYSHPYYWQFFADGDSEKEAPFLSRYKVKTWEGDAVQRWMGLFASKRINRKEDQKLSLDLSDDYDIPRAFAVEKFDIKKEIGGSVRMVNTLAPPGKKVEVLMWSGDTSPFEEAIRLTRQEGIRNINGGDSRFDREYPSLSWVSSVGIQEGGQRQVFASNSNENTYTDLWTGRYYGFKYLIQTIKNTETPVRLKPFNVYYHMYSGEKMASLNALLDNLNYARTQSIIPVTASNYCAVADGFYTTRFVPLGERQWRIENRDGLQTIRFDQATLQAVDFEKSVGVVGAHYYQGSLYVYLDEGVKAPVLALKTNTHMGMYEKASTPYLIESHWKVWGTRLDKGEVVFMAQGFGKGEMVWYVPQDGAYMVTFKDRVIKAVAKQHMLTLSVDGQAEQPVEMRIKYSGAM